MLFPYVYVPHSMDKMQEFIDFIFDRVWCEAPANPEYSLDLFNDCPELLEVMTAFHYSISDNAYFFNGHVQCIHGLFVTLPVAEIQQLKAWYLSNNDIENICANNPSSHLARYTEIRVLNARLAEQLASFFKGLYKWASNPPAAMKGKIGDIDNHYEKFMALNSSGKCPFCGISDMKGIYHTRREAYDHYLPKALYPFNSINFRNLVPACNTCNSSYKTSKDPGLPPKDPCNSAQRRRFFYPYSEKAHNIEITVELDTSDLDKLEPENINLGFESPAYNEEVETWKEVYGVEERYKAKCCSENDGKYWLEQMLDEWEEHNRTPEEYLSTLSRLTQRRPWADNNFLKKPFLEACERMGVFV